MVSFFAKVQNVQNLIFGLFWALFAQFWKNGGFPEKSGFVTFLHLLTPKTFQKIRKNKPNGILDTRKYRIAKIAEIVEVADIAELWKLLEDIMKKKINRLKSFPIKISRL